MNVDLVLLFPGRFVRFVSTPAVLERFVSLEAEINQIETSIQQDSSGISLGGKQFSFFLLCGHWLY